MKLYRDFATQEAIDAAYNVELMVPDLKPYVDRFVRDSAAARETLACVPDVRFGPTLDETMDVFPAPSPGAPIVVFIHGGYWRRLSSKEFSLVAHGLVAHGFTVAVTNYSLCPKVTIAEITRQSRAAIAWLHQHAREFNGDPDKFVACGHSAGGQQVGMLVVTDWEGEYGLPADILRAGIPISGVFDLRPLRHSWLQPKIQLNHDVIERESPAFQIPRAGPPMLVVVGGEESDEFLRQSREYRDACTANGTPAEFLIATGLNHFSVIEALAERDSALCAAVAKFVHRSVG